MKDEWSLKKYYLNDQDAYVPDCDHQHWTKEDIDKFNKEYMQKNNKQYSNYVLKYYHKNKKRLNPISVMRAKTRKELGIPKECIICGDTEKLEWHHFTYNKKDSWKDCIGTCKGECHRALDKARREILC